MSAPPSTWGGGGVDVREAHVQGQMSHICSAVFKATAPRSQAVSCTNTNFNLQAVVFTDRTKIDTLF